MTSVYGVIKSLVNKMYSYIKGLTNQCTRQKILIKMSIKELNYYKLSSVERKTLFIV